MIAPTIVFRCDASRQIGTGHVMRCRRLARALQGRGADITFLCRRHACDLIALLQQEFRVLVLPELPPILPEVETASPLSGRALYATWLGCSEEQDALDSLAALAAAHIWSASWIVLDHYGLGEGWQRLMMDGLRQPQGPALQLLVLDDLADRKHQASVLMDANRLEPATPDPYQDLVGQGCTTLLGPGYALLDPLYSLMQPTMPLRSRLSRVLVFFGGMDTNNHAALGLEALSHPALLHLGVDVVVGEAAPHRAALERLASQRPNTSLHVGLPSLAGLMARADLALGAAGTTSWERACLGLPSLVVPVAENQEQGARALELAGVARCLNLQAAANPVATMQSALLELLDAPATLQAMSEACLQLGDGRGLSRVVAALLGPATGLRLRSPQAADLWLYHWWANDPQVRLQSFNRAPIPLAQHRRWFASRLHSPLALLRVLVDGDGLPLGQIRFEREAESDARAVIAFSLDRLARGRGLASQLLELGVEELARAWGKRCEAYGEVRVDNPASCTAFLRAGFHEGPSPRSGVRCFAKTARSEP